MRRFEGLSHVLHENIPFSIVKISCSTSTIFVGDLYDRVDERKVVAEVGASEVFDEGKSCVDSGDKSHEFLLDDCHESFVVYLVLSGERNLLSRQNNSGFHCLTERVQMVSIPDSVEELCDECFCDCESISRVTFGDRSSLKRIGKKAFRECGLREIRIPDSVEELCDECFCGCMSLSRVIFGDSSSLKRIGKESSWGSSETEIRIPGRIERLVRKSGISNVTGRFVLRQDKRCNLL